MPIEIIKIISPYVLAVFGALVSMVAFMIKKLVERIQKIEDKQFSTPTRVDTRTLINEKIEPIEKRIDKIDHKLDKILDILIHKN